MEIHNIETLREEHQWILKPIENAIKEIEKLPFYMSMEKINTVAELFPITRQLFHHSVTFPKAIGLMLSTTSVENGYLYKMYSEHAFEEATHHLMLFDWMKKNNGVKEITELFEEKANSATNNCINLGYQLAIERDYELWIVMINLAIERAFLSLFSILNDKVNKLCVGHEYFSIHVVADVGHSLSGLEYLKVLDPKSRKGSFLIKKSLDSLSVWTTMIHSWIDVNLRPHFNNDGLIIKNNILN